eukprot:TRINITY_DN9844_c0_g1_i1.p1 TRINITY_DN9844_c0_g1~~TRINITY_DN9844_c0_g1_i1.p1  ORF type:complete len:347 (+),score=60.31 TRINITY_DN9844_c0_g1_i1:81-1121(+)
MVSLHLAIVFLTLVISSHGLQRWDAKDTGIVMTYGKGPNQCDIYGARDVWVYRAPNGTYIMHYDAAGPLGWLSARAISNDLVNWERQGPILSLGAPGSGDSASASYGTTYYDSTSKSWAMFYLGTPNTTPPPDRIPSFPYLTFKATSDSAWGPWLKQYDVIPFRPTPDTYDAATASPGFIIQDEHSGNFSQYFSCSANIAGATMRSIALATTRNLNSSWEVAAEPLLPETEQIENSSMYFDEESRYWFMFVNHIQQPSNAYTDAVYVYWTRDRFVWNVDNKAVVLDGQNCLWSSLCIGLPSVLQVGNRLAVFYDAPGGTSTSHMQRSVGLAWMSLPLYPPFDVTVV